MPPLFGGDIGDVHDHVVARMFALLSGSGAPPCLDSVAAALLAEGRAEYRLLGLHDRPVIATGTLSWLLVTGRGTVATATLALVLQSRGWNVLLHDGLLEVRRKGDPVDLADEIRRIRDTPPPPDLLPLSEVGVEKFHPWLGPDLIRRDMLSSRLDPDSLRGTCAAILAAGPGPVPPPGQP